MPHETAHQTISMEHYDDIQQRKRVLAYAVADWPKCNGRRIKYDSRYGEPVPVPLWARKYENVLRESASEALRLWEAEHRPWKWQGHFCVTVEIHRPRNTTAEPQEIVECVDRVNVDLFYPPDATREIQSLVSVNDLRPSVRVFVFRSIAHLQARHAA